MSNPDSSTPSIQALDRAVKPTGMTWEQFSELALATDAHAIALAYAADLDKADKVAKAFERVAEKGMIDFPVEQATRLREEVRSMLLPEPIDPDLQLAKELSEQWSGLADRMDFETVILATLKRGRELAKEQDRG